MSSNHRVWVTPADRMDTNLNETALHSENPLKVGNITSKSTVLPMGLDSSTDFLLSHNLHDVLNVSKLLVLNSEIVSLKNDHDKILPPRDQTCVASYNNKQVSDQIETTDLKTGSQDVVPLKNVHAMPKTTELEPSDKDTAVCNAKKETQPQHIDIFNQLMDDCGIECREETVVCAMTERAMLEQESVIRDDSHTHQYVQGQITFGNKSALEMLARDANRLKTGTHGVITNPVYSFFTNPKSAQKRQKILGRGGNGTVELWNFKESSFVTKTIFRDFRPNEVLFTNTLSHEFIVKSHGLIVRNGTPQIIMDYAGDNLLHYGLSRMVNENEIWNFTFQILEALNYLHSKQIRHFDVKPENIVLMEDESGNKTLKLADFGGATLFTEEVDCLSWTPAYMAPEMCQFYLNRQFPKQRAFQGSCGPVTEKCDIYSLALSILFLYVRGHVLIKHATKGMQTMVGPEKADTVSMKIVIMNAQNPDLGESLIPQCVGKEMRSILSSMLKGNVDDRVTAKHAMDQMKEFSSVDNIISKPKTILRRKSKSSENKQNIRQPIRPKIPKIVIVTLDNKGREVKKYSSTNVLTNYDMGRQLFGNSLETEEQQRPLRDLNIDLQLNILLEQTNNISDAKMKQVIEEENRPLLQRLVKRKLKDKVNGERAFKMTKIFEELVSGSSSSNNSEKENTSSLSLTVNVVHDEPEYMSEGPGNLPNFEFLDF